MFRKPDSFDYFSVGGCSGSDGFDLTFATNNGHRRTVRYRLPDTDANAKRRLDWPVIALFAIMYLAAFANTLIWPKVFVCYLLFRGVETLMERQVKSWHWVEHQAAMWLESHKKDIKDINPISPRCGSVMLIAKGMFFASAAMVFWDYGFRALPVMVSSLALWAGRDCVGEFMHMRPWIQNVITGLAWPTTMIALGLQRILFMRRPSPEQTAIASAWAQRTATIIADTLLARQIPVLVVIKIRSGDSR